MSYGQTDIIQDLEKEVSQLKESNHSLRMAVAQYFNKRPQYGSAVMVGVFTVVEREAFQLALSAGIEFTEGQWKLKENSEGK